MSLNIRHQLPKYSNNSIDNELAIQLLTTMMRIREFEERVADLVTEKKIITPCHLYSGQEAVAAGVCCAINNDDYLFSNHRSHGHYIAKGGNINSAMAELFGRVTGCSSGRGGSMHLTAPEVGIMGSSSIVAGSLGIALGPALAGKISGNKKISVVFHGDGVMEEGIWHEAANFAAIMKLPMLFVCENNLYCTHLALDKRRVSDNLCEVAQAHGLKASSVDGNNVLDVYTATQNVLQSIRQGKGPIFLECRTYRWRGHVGPNYDVDLGLRSEEELASWKKCCPIGNYSQYLVSKGIITEQQLLDINNKVVHEINGAVDYAINSEYPKVEDIYKNIYKGGTPSCQ